MHGSPRPYCRQRQVHALNLADQRDKQKVVSKALEVMRGWLKLMVVEMAAEFPEWEFVQSFSPFNLEDTEFARAHREGPTLRRHLCRIARVLNIPEPELHWEFVTHLAVAQSNLKEFGGSFKSAWCKACSASSGVRPNKHLEAALMCWLATCCSTSGVECNFAKGDYGFRDKQLTSDSQHERSTHRVLLYAGNVSKMVAGAQHVWRRCFGVVRSSGSDNRKTRVDVGAKRKSESCPELRAMCCACVALPAPLPCATCLPWLLYDETCAKHMVARGLCSEAKLCKMFGAPQISALCGFDRSAKRNHMFFWLFGSLAEAWGVGDRLLEKDPQLSAPSRPRLGGFSQ